MLLARSTPEARDHQRIVHVNGHDYVLSEFIGTAPTRGRYVAGNEANGNDLPQGFLVEQPPGSVTPPHFHNTNQFQVFVGGSGHMGKKEAFPVTVHYAGGNTPYGPIAAGADGVQYFTLRQLWDSGAKYMPESRDMLPDGPRRHRLSDEVPVCDEDALRDRGTAALETVMEAEADGLVGYILRLGGGQAAACPDPSSGGGQYHVVVNGTLIHDCATLPPLSCRYVTPDEPAPQAIAGEGGLEMLILQFPRG
ncbi:MAG: hypothetical protein OEU46_17655 [Alphaproteobacteria bacterium]|nr:hypothetical protein [Alphaproteobacteria bacterium]